MTDTHHWWYAYGQFDLGENNLPHLGQVVQHYRELRQWRVKDLAVALGQSTRHIYEIESSTNMPELISRRQALSSLLKIPPVLMGLSVITENTQDLETQGTAINSRHMKLYEGILELSWELFYTSNAQRAASNIDHWLRFLQEAVKEATGIHRDQLLAMLCRFYQLSGVAARDRMDLSRALRDSKKATDIALQLENAELIAASLFRRAKTYQKQNAHKLAVRDLEAALPYADRSRSPLKGYVYQATAEEYAIIANNDVQTQKKSLQLLDQVGRIVRKGNLEDDGSFVKLNIAGLYMDRARAFTKFGKLEEAHYALNIARENLGPELTRWQSRLLLADAQIYIAEDDPESSCHLALEALKVVRATQSRSNETRIYQVWQQLQPNHAHHPLVKRLEAQLTHE